MKKLKYEIEDSTIAELLGVQNFTNKESAILELVKNSFDAGATELKIKFLKKELILLDNGKGMNIDDIERKWMHIGKSTKENEYLFCDKNGEQRVYSGSKGIGRFALARLGKNVKIISKTEKDSAVFWETDWVNNDYKIIDEQKYKEGTQVKICDLRDKWTKGSITTLKKYLSRTFKNIVMKITIEFEEEKYEIEEFYDKPKFGENCLSIIKFKYSAVDKKLECVITSDEFLDEIKKYYNGDHKSYKEVVDIYTEFSDNETENQELKDVLEGIGNFNGEFYFGISATDNDANKFLYKYIKIPSKYDGGIGLYRNFFSISSYDGSKDWIGLGVRARKSPAAATHPTGDWKVRENNISGKIEIDKNENYMLRDLSNRQGFEENEYYEYFLKIIEVVLEKFEEYRQEIIREVNKKNILEEITEEIILKKILKNPNNIDRLEEKEKIKLIEEILNLKTREKKYKEGLKETEKNFQYDARILNVFSTVGLKATSIAHDIQNDRNIIDNVCENLKKALIKHNVWGKLEEPENQKKAAYNVPKMLINSDKINKKMSLFVGTLLQDVKKNKFKEERLNIYQNLYNIKKIWERDYGKLNIELIIDSEILFNSSEDIIKVIFDNLILNSFQQNKIKDLINIKIKIEKIENMLNVIYQDDGKGLHKKYSDKPMRILNVHETTRTDGHGLGMWITNNTIKKTTGEIKYIGNVSNDFNAINKGFHMEFTLGSEE